MDGEDFWRERERVAPFMANTSNEKKYGLKQEAREEAFSARCISLNAAENEQLQPMSAKLVHNYTSSSSKHENSNKTPTRYFHIKIAKVVQSMHVTLL